MSSGTLLHSSDVGAKKRRVSTDSRFPVEVPIYGCGGSDSGTKRTSYDNQVLQGSILYVEEQESQGDEINNIAVYYVHSVIF